jgi:hypothetical protein
MTPMIAGSSPRTGRRSNAVPERSSKSAPIRAAFARHVRETLWDRLHLIYFLGYAVWDYLTARLRHRRAARRRSALLL